MKVILVGDYPKDDKIQTGVQGVLVSLTNELLKQKEIDLVLVPISKGDYINIYRERCTIRAVNLRSSIFLARRKFRSIILEERPDIIHLQGVVPGSFLFSKRYKAIFIVTQHAILSKERLWQVSVLRQVKFYVKELVESYYLKKIQNIIFISDYNKEFYRRKIKAHHLLNHATIPNPVNGIFNKMGVHSDASWKNELYFVGEIKKRKGLHVLIRALAYLKERKIDFKLHVIGGFKEMAYKKHILNLIEDTGLNTKILFCGWKDPAEIIEYTKDIPIFVLPSFQETLPLSIAEAMTLGKLAVATDVGGTSEMIEDGRSGFLFRSGDHEGLAHILMSVFNQPDHYMKVISNAKKDSEKYKQDQVLEQTLNFYQSTINKSLK